MATKKGDLTNILQEYLIRKTLENFEPQLYFYKLGEKPVIPAGYNTIRWAKFTKLGEVSAVATEGTTPTDTAFIASSVATVTPTEYIAVITITDRLLKESVLDWLGGASKALGDALARTIDATIQTTIMAGGEVMYAGNQTARANLVSGNVLTVSLLIKAAQRLKTYSAPTFDGFYVAVMHPRDAYDLMTSTSAGGWQDVKCVASLIKQFIKTNLEICWNIFKRFDSLLWNNIKYKEKISRYPHLSLVGSVG